jgi:hypothetical protein
LELEGIATTLTSWNAGVTRLTLPPRATFTRLARGSTIGGAGDTAQQLRVLKTTLELLEQPAPLEPVQLEESIEQKNP